MNEETQIQVPGDLASLAYREGFRDARKIVYREGDVRFHGYDGRFVAPGRRVVDGTWKYTSPEVCEFEEDWGVWLPGDQVMVCPGCGLDAT